MLEIAGGIVLGAAALFVISAVLPEIVVLVKWTLGTGLAIAVLCLGCAYLIGGWHFALRITRHPQLVEWPEKLFTVVTFWSGIALIWDAFNGFPGTLALIEFAGRTWQMQWLSRWRTRYRLVFEHDGTPVAYAPYQWIARKLAKGYYPTKIQRRLD